MEFGFVMPSLGPMANKADITALAQYGETKGCNYLSAPDHIIIPEDIESTYPYSQTGEFPLRAHNGWLDQLTTLTFIAAVTNKARLLTSVMVVPHRSAVLTAKILASIDVLSNGRLTVGCGAGWMREEFEAIGAPPFKERGKVTDEFIDVGPKIHRNLMAHIIAFQASFSNPSRCKNLIPQFGSAAKVTLHCAALHD